MAGDETRNPVKFIIIPKRISDERRRRIRASHRKYNKKRPKKYAMPNRERPFIFWDGEGPQDAGYALFGNSAGYEICHPYLETGECLDLILRCEKENPEAIHIAFGFNYDASMIMRQLPWRCLNALKVYGGTYWHDYEIEHIPHKWFKVRKDGITAQIFDIRNFFPGSYVSALLSLQVGNPDDLALISSGKAQRAIFQYSEIAEIRDYWKTELKLGPLLAEKLRTAFLGAGFDLTSWHGPGALARMALKKHNVFDAMCESPAEVKEAARYAFAGGRFEMFRGGHIKGKVYNADLRSAYPAYARDLPNLSHGQWRAGRHYEPGKFGIYHISYENNERNPLYVHPLFRREKSGIVCWPGKVDGWYHGPEAGLVADDPNAAFLEAWIFDEDDPTDRPFKWIEEYYDERQKYKSAGNPIELTFKLIINSVYGQLAQRTGWDRKHKLAPKTHQLEWAGYITSACRAAIYKTARNCGDKLISIDTDGLYSMAPIGIIEGKRLGEWELDQFDEGIFWQSGIYALRNSDGIWAKGKTRGIPKGTYSAQQLLHALDKGKDLHIKVHKFIGYGLALNGQYDRLNTWEDELRTIVFGGQGKRYHNIPYYCAKGMCPGDGLHNFLPAVSFTKADTCSVPHYLPWLDNSSELHKTKELIRSVTLYDANHLEDEMEWVREYA